MQVNLHDVPGSLQEHLTVFQAKGPWRRVRNAEITEPFCGGHEWDPCEETYMGITLREDIVGEALVL